MLTSYISCTLSLIDGTQIVGQIGAKCTEIYESPRIVSFWANLTHFGTKPDNFYPWWYLHPAGNQEQNTQLSDIEN